MSGTADGTTMCCTESMAVEDSKYHPTSTSPCEEFFPLMEFVP